MKNTAELQRNIAGRTKQIETGWAEGDFTIAANSYHDWQVTFSERFALQPTVLTSLYSTSTAGGGTGSCAASAINVTRDGFTMRVFNGDTYPRAPSAQWIAVGDLA